MFPRPFRGGVYDVDAPPRRPLGGTDAGVPHDMGPRWNLCAVCPLVPSSVSRALTLGLSKKLFCGAIREGILLRLWASSAQELGGPCAQQAPLDELQHLGVETRRIEYLWNIPGGVAGRAVKNIAHPAGLSRRGRLYASCPCGAKHHDAGTLRNAGTPIFLVPGVTFLGDLQIRFRLP